MNQVSSSSGHEHIEQDSREGSALSDAARNVTAAEDRFLRNAVKRASKLVADGQFSPCACIGPAGDCPCIRRSRGQKVEVTETQIHPDLFALLPDEDKETINRLKLKALGLYMQSGDGSPAR